MWGGQAVGFTPYSLPIGHLEDSICPLTLLSLPAWVGDLAAGLHAAPS